MFPTCDITSTVYCFLDSVQVVYNFSRGESELQSLFPWLLNIQARAPSSPVIIVGTHVDRIPHGNVFSFPNLMLILNLGLAI